MKEETRTCPVCGEQIIGRVDKKFCTDQCRNEYNNKRYTLSNEVVKSINRVLKKNYNILVDLNKTGKTKVSRSRLLKEGFDFTYYTSIYETKKGGIYKLVYDQGYIALSDDLFLLIKWDSAA